MTELLATENEQNCKETRVEEGKNIMENRALCRLSGEDKA